MNDDSAFSPHAKLLSLARQRALVTGASGNIGRGIALRLAEAGAEVLVHYHSDEKGALETVALVNAAGGKADVLPADLATENGVADMFAAIDADGGAVTCVVNNTGTYEVHTMEEMTGDAWHKSLSTNLDSAFRVSKAAAGRMVTQGSSGSVVNISSIEGSDPAPGHAHYATAKAGLLMLTRACAQEYGDKGIRFNAVSPGLIDRAGITESWPEGVQRWQKHAPLVRLGSTEDVANAVLFLLSSAASWVSGAEIKVDGGMSAVSRW